MRLTPLEGRISLLVELVAGICCPPCLMEAPLPLDAGGAFLGPRALAGGHHQRAAGVSARPPDLKCHLAGGLGQRWEE